MSVSEKIDFIRRALGSIEMGRDNVNVAVKCPSCGGKSSGKKKLVIRVDDDRYHCWVCGMKGRNLFSLLKKYAPSFLNEYRSLTGKKFQAGPLENEKESIVIPKGFLLLGQNTKSKDPDIRDVIRYVKKRGLSLSDMWYFRLGTCKTGRYRRRVILPSFDGEGNLNYYSARSIDSCDKMKYLNAKVAKSEIIFNEMNNDWNQELTLVEGPFDLTKCDSNAVCLLGSHLSENSVLFRRIVKSRTPIILALDPDAKSKSHEIAKLLSSYDVRVKVMTIKNHSDVGEMTRKEFLTAKSRSIPWNQNDRLISLIGNIRSGSRL